MQVTSQSKNIVATKQKIYEMLCDCRKFEKMIPVQSVQNLTFGDDYCEFEVAGIAKMRVEIAQRVENSLVVYKVLNDKNLPASCTFQVGGSDLAASVEVKLDVDIPIFLAGMVRKPLQQGADVAAQKIKEAAEMA